ncbi:glycosyltransferase [bacterium]|nr:glycosyltransferase [bacterium]
METIDIAKKNISVVIPSYKPGSDILTCLESVLNQKTDYPFDVTVVDSSPASPAEMIQARFPEVTVVHLQQRTYPGKARSAGAAAVKGDIVCFTDVDCVLDPYWLEQHLEEHRRGYKIVGGSVVNGTPDSLFGTAEYITEFRELNPGVKAGTVKGVASCNLSVAREVFDTVGYFPDFMKAEDTMFCEYARSKGFAIFFNPDAKITHMNRTSFKAYVRNQVYLGEGEVEVRRRTNIYGSFLIDYPFLLPLVPIYRTVMTFRCFLFSDRTLLLKTAAMYPLILLGFVAHVWGFIRGPYKAGLSTEKKQSGNRQGRIDHD